jgi:Tfp pilus assembly protein PilN
MIEINLKAQKQAIQLPVLAGLDLNNLNLKWIFIAILFSYMPDFLITDRWQAEIQAEEEINKNLKIEGQKLKAKIAQDGELQKKIDDFLVKEKQLNNRLEAVKTVTKNRRNPWKILHYLSVNIPETVWVNDLKVDGIKLEIKGQSADPDSINTFLENLKNSIFFEENQPILTDIFQSKTEETNQNLFTFSIQGSIRRFE